jgi:hypothetical protein
MMNALHNICSIGVVLVQQISAIRTAILSANQSPHWFQPVGVFFLLLPNLQTKV